ncbi:MAG TPA: hypothetical protein VHT97_00485 [Acidimicrobiales bacterium]|jgi:hypothetical protein|nr:hypothetical protein [Acidimicrobiales bacterium]
METLLVGYARVSTGEEDLTAQRDALAAFGVGAPTWTRRLTDTDRSAPARGKPGHSPCGDCRQWRPGEIDVQGAHLVA